MLIFGDKRGMIITPNKPNIDEQTVICSGGSIPFSALTFEFAKNAIPQVRALGNAVIVRFLIWFVWRQSELRF